MLAFQRRMSQGDKHCPQAAESNSLLLRRLRWGKAGLVFRTWLDPCVSAFLKRVTFHLPFNVSPTWLTLPRRTGNQSAVDLCCWRTISDTLGKFPKSFLTLLLPPASSVNCQNITLAGDSKGVEVVAISAQLTAVSGSSRQVQDVGNEGLKPCPGQRQWALEGGSEHCPTLPQIFHPALLARMSEGTPTHTGTGASKHHFMPLRNTGVTKESFKN